MDNRKLRDRIFLFIRVALILSFVLNLASALILILEDSSVTKAEVMHEISRRFELVFFAVLTFVLTFGSSYIEKREGIDIPDILEIVIVLFIYAGIFLSVRYNLYYRFFWWDDLLHTLSGVIIGFIGFIVIYKINCRFSMDISPLLVAIFSFCFAVTMGVMWEIGEFTTDIVLGTANQKWNLPATEIMMGKAYQGSGLRDTMSDLIVDSVGALITSTITYKMYKYKKVKMLEGVGKLMKNR